MPVESRYGNPRSVAQLRDGHLIAPREKADDAYSSRMGESGDVFERLFHGASTGKLPRKRSHKLLRGRHGRIVPHAVLDPATGSTHAKQAPRVQCAQTLRGRNAGNAVLLGDLRDRQRRLAE